VLQILNAKPKLTANQCKIAFAATLDFFNCGLITCHRPAPDVPGMGMIPLASGIGAVGSRLWGWAADKIGRRRQ
jgi:hypothetical protein